MLASFEESEREPSEEVKEPRKRVKKKHKQKVSKEEAESARSQCGSILQFSALAKIVIEIFGFDSLDATMRRE